jgi:hypothetical protein
MSAERVECPACGEPGERAPTLPVDQARCREPPCRVTTFQTTTPPDRYLDP